MTPPSPTERATAALVALVAAVLLVTAVFGSGPPRTEAAAPEPTPALTYFIATPMPAASQQDAPPIAQQPVQRATAAPVQPLAPAIAAAEPAAPEPPAPAAQIIYQADGSAVLPGVDGPVPGPAPPADAAQSAQLAADAQLYSNLPVAGEPLTSPAPLTIRSRGNR